jgi:uncharacterized protein YjbI with pentapeptide repeats
VGRGEKTAVWVLGVIGLLAALAVGAYFGGKWLWGELAAYIRPDNATERKDLVNVFVLIGAGIVGSLTALAAIVNASISRGNLQHAREALREQGDREEQRAQDDALQDYFKQMGELLTDHELKEAQPESAVSLLARAQTLTVLGRVDARRKRDLLLFLYGAGLISKENIVNLYGADLSGAHLSGADLEGADLRGAILSSAHLRDAKLRGANLSSATLYEANLAVAKLPDANLSSAILGSADLGSADLSSANLSSAHLLDADLMGAHLSGADLRGAILFAADLSHATLRGANLTVATLSYANLLDANLTDANLTGAKGWTEAQLRATKSLEDATMPDGQKYEYWLKSRGEGWKNSGP